MTTLDLEELLHEYRGALGYTTSLVADLSPEEIAWRPHQESSAIGWHLGHQAAVAHFMIRNLTAAEPEIDPDLDRLMDSATAERDRGALPDVERILDYRDTIEQRVHATIGLIDAGEVGAPAQLRIIARTLLVAVVNHEYQHSKWIGEVRTGAHGRPLPAMPDSPNLSTIDGYQVLGAG